MAVLLGILLCLYPPAYSLLGGRSTLPRLEYTPALIPEEREKRKQYNIIA
jgi:hypothetical protein